jgi:hypothetical protein
MNFFLHFVGNNHLTFYFRVEAMFIAHLAKGKGNVSFCHHLASVVRRPLTFHILIFSETPQPNELKLGRKQEKNFKNQPIRNKYHLWRPCLLMDRDEMSNLYRGPPLDAS